MGNSHDVPNQKVRKGSSQPKGKAQLVIKTFTWSRDSHGLFDYEGKNLSKKNIKTHRSAIITRSGEDIRIIKDADKRPSQEEKELLRFVLRDGTFWITSCKQAADDRNGADGVNINENNEIVDNGLWLVANSIKTNNNKGYQLNEGDLIKLGRIRFRIKEIQGVSVPGSQKPVKTEVENEASPNHSIANLNESMKTSSLGSNPVCRICLSESSEVDNPFFSPCCCAGTMKNVHVKCLQRWLKSKLHIKDNGQSISIYWKALECELCKTGYPNSFQVNDQRYDIVEIDRPTCAFLMLEVLNKETDTVKGVHIIKMENKTNIRLGRGHDSDIRITDISVSRCHAIIKLDKGKYYLEDNTSKFGTLVNIKKSFPLSGANNSVSLQVGRTLISLNVKRSKAIFPICFSQSQNVDTSNDEINSDGEDVLETEHNAPSRNSLYVNNPNANSNPQLPENFGNDHDNDNEVDHENVPADNNAVNTHINNNGLIDYN